MPRPYPDPSFTTLTGMWDYANTITGEWFSVLFLIAASGVIFTIMIRQEYRASDSFMVAFMLTTVLSAMLWITDLLSTKILMIFFGLTILSVLWSVFDR